MSAPSSSPSLSQGIQNAIEKTRKKKVDNVAANKIVLSLPPMPSPVPEFKKPVIKRVRETTKKANEFKTARGIGGGTKHGDVKRGRKKKMLLFAIEHKSKLPEEENGDGDDDENEDVTSPNDARNHKRVLVADSSASSSTEGASRAVDIVLKRPRTSAIASAN
jgi:hypothetical protein